MPRPPSKKPTALGIHIFAGGFTCGLKQVGFNVLAHFEDCNAGVKTAKKNWPEMPIFVGRNTWPVPLPNPVDFIYSNPPCAIFSAAGIVTTRGEGSWYSDPRLQMWYQALEVCQAIHPQVFLLESVTQAYSRGRPIIDKFTMVGLKVGYSVQHIMMDAKWCGIPQTRKRFFLVFHDPDLDLQFKPDFSKPPTVKEVLDQVKDPGEIPDYHHRSADLYGLMEKTPPGGKFAKTFDKLFPDAPRGPNGKVIGRPGFVWGRLPRDGQAGAFIEQPGHYEELRFIGTNEMKALCGYPEDFQVVGSGVKSMQTQMAQAVLPPVGRWVGQCVKSALKKRLKRKTPQTVTFMDLRQPSSIVPIDISEEYDPFTRLVKEAHACVKCSRMEGRTRVLSERNGPVPCDIMFIAEAPGRHGADRTAIPLFGDTTGINFGRLLQSIGLKREEVFATNLILCNPQDEIGRNSTPTIEEIENCSEYLVRTIEVVCPMVIVTLGRKALEGLSWIAPHQLELKRHVATPHRWLDYLVFPLYHPSPRVLSTRNFAKQREDFKQLKKLLQRID